MKNRQWVILYGFLTILTLVPGYYLFVQNQMGCIAALVGFVFFLERTIHFIKLPSEELTQ